MFYHKNITLYIVFYPYFIENNPGCMHELSTKMSMKTYVLSQKYYIIHCVLSLFYRK